jgi:hypothetical protein
MELTGTLRWNDLEGGFWYLELDAPLPHLGDHVILAGAPIGADLDAGTHLRVVGKVQVDAVDFLMAGPRFEVNELHTDG